MQYFEQTDEATAMGDIFISREEGTDGDPFPAKRLQRGVRRGSGRNRRMLDGRSAAIGKTPAVLDEERKERPRLLFEKLLIFCHFSVNLSDTVCGGIVFHSRANFNDLSKLLLGLKADL